MAEPVIQSASTTAPVDPQADLLAILVDSSLHGHQPSTELMAALFSTLQSTTSKASCQSIEQAGYDFRAAAANDECMLPPAHHLLNDSGKSGIVHES